MWSVVAVATSPSTSRHGRQRVHHSRLGRGVGRGRVAARPGRREQIPVLGFAPVTRGCAAVGVIIAAVVRRRASRPAHMFTALALAAGRVARPAHDRGRGHQNR